MGNTAFGIDIYVPSKLFEVPKELVSSNDTEKEYIDVKLTSEDEIFYNEEKQKLKF